MITVPVVALEKKKARKTFPEVESQSTSCISDAKKNAEEKKLLA